MPRFRFQTQYLDVDTAKCRACEACVEACTNGVLAVRGIQFPFNYRHVHVVKRDKCTCCLACVRACPDGALQSLRSQT
jgi:2-oxoglutarate ferredoxin oxidoreductase subunit delta